MKRALHLARGIAVLLVSLVNGAALTLHLIAIRGSWMFKPPFIPIFTFGLASLVMALSFVGGCLLLSSGIK